MEQDARREPERAEGALAARGMADAAAILARRFTLQATNVPFLGRGRQERPLPDHLQSRFDTAKADLATAMVMRMRGLAAPGGAVASVTPQNWLFLGSYKKMREALLAQASLAFVAVLGEHGFDSSAAAGAFTALVGLTETRPDARTAFAGLDANDASDPAGKAAVLREKLPITLPQAEKRAAVDFRISVQAEAKGPILASVAIAPNGMHGADLPRFRRFFWEHVPPTDNWAAFQLTVDRTQSFGGREHVFWWSKNGQVHRDNPQARLQGEDAWKRDGVVVSMMRELAVTRYTGEKFDISCTPIVPHDPAHLPAIWAFCSSPDYVAAVRRIDRKLNVTNATLVKVPFDLAHWQKVAAEKYPNGLPEPYSDDPTQWLFHGHPRYAEAGTELHVALARLAGYRWPTETDTEMRLSAEARAHIAEAATLPEADANGLLPVTAVAGERALAERLRGYLAIVFGQEWSDALERRLVAEADEVFDKRPARDGSLEAWLRDRAFRQHCTLFHQRPFLWHVWDGQADGFAAILHYHRLSRANLERLTFTLLGDWIARMRDAGDNRRAEAARILQEKLQRNPQRRKALRHFRPLEARSRRQPIGWSPDLDDGVRLNIRPLMSSRRAARICRTSNTA